MPTPMTPYPGSRDPQGVAHSANPNPPGIRAMNHYHPGTLVVEVEMSIAKLLDPTGTLHLLACDSCTKLEWHPLPVVAFICRWCELVEKRGE